jgi:hypothetical protein
MCCSSSCEGSGISVVCGAVFPEAAAGGRSSTRGKTVAIKACVWTARHSAWATGAWIIRDAR